jgi:hypothetical protein
MMAKPGCMYVLTFTFPSGNRYAAGEVDGKFAFVEIPPDGRLRGVLAWKDIVEFEMWLSNFKTNIGEVKWSNLMTLRPEIGQVKIAQ